MMTSGVRWLIALALVLGCQVSALAGTVWQVDFVLTVEQQLTPTDQWPPSQPYLQPQVGDQYFGSLTFCDEELTGIGKEGLALEEGRSGLPSAYQFGLLDVTLDYYDQHCTQRDAQQYPWDPIASFEDGLFSNLYFYVNAHIGNVWIYDDHFQVDLVTYGWTIANGSVAYGKPMAVPAPAAAGAGMLLLSVLGLKRRRRAA